jgi:hypothetical protein
MHTSVTRHAPFLSAVIHRKEKLSAVLSARKVQKKMDAFNKAVQDYLTTISFAKRRHSAPADRREQKNK